MAKRKLSSTQICYRISLALLPIMLGLSLLYQAGILQGSDAEGNFHPGDWITRAEATAILNRLCQKDARIGA